MPHALGRRDGRWAVRALGVALVGLLLLLVPGEGEATRIDGSLVLRLRSSGALAEGVRLAVLGEGPELIVANTAGGVVVVLDDEGEPYVRLDARGVAVRPTSPVWTAQDRTDAEGRTVDELGYVLVDEGADHAWIDPRTQPPEGAVTDAVRADDEETQLVRWEIVVDVDGERHDVAGETVWLPLAVRRAGEVPRSAVPTEWLVAVLVAGALGVVLWRRRASGGGSRP